MATTKGPEFNFYYTNIKEDIKPDNPDMTNGTFWFCDQDRTIGIKMDNVIKEFAKPRVLIDNKSNNTHAFLDCIRIVTTSSEIDKDEDANVLYFVLDDRSISMVVNDPVTYKYEFAG